MQWSLPDWITVNLSTLGCPWTWPRNISQSKMWQHICWWQHLCECTFTQSCARCTGWIKVMVLTFKAPCRLGPAYLWEHLSWYVLCTASNLQSFHLWNVAASVKCGKHWNEALFFLILQKKLLCHSYFVNVQLRWVNLEKLLAEKKSIVSYICNCV